MAVMVSGGSLMPGQVDLLTLVWLVSGKRGSLAGVESLTSPACSTPHADSAVSHWGRCSEAARRRDAYLNIK